MRFTKRFLMVVGAAVSIAAVTAAILPKAAHSAAAILVQVVNTSANPALTRGVNDRDTYPVVFQLCIADNCFGVPFFATIPSTTSDGHAVRLAVIDLVDARCTFPNNEVLQLGTTFQGVGYQYSISVPNLGTNGVGFVDAPTHIYVDPGSTLNVNGVFGFGPGQNPQCQSIVVSGHLLSQ